MRQSAGGWNKTHDMLEECPRLDSFEFGKMYGFTYCGNDYVQYECDEVLDEACCRLALEINGTTRCFLTLVEHKCKSKQYFFMCPECGKRVRYIYKRFLLGFGCRSCCRLNYKKQQERLEPHEIGYKALEFAAIYFGAATSNMTPVECLDFVPDRPKGMKQAKYNRLLAKYQKIVDEYEREYIAEVEWIIGRKIVF